MASRGPPHRLTSSPNGGVPRGAIGEAGARRRQRVRRSGGLAVAHLELLARSAWAGSVLRRLGQLLLGELHTLATWSFVVLLDTTALTGCRVVQVPGLGCLEPRTGDLDPVARG